MNQTRPDPEQSPVAIGAIGGSGSRVLARIIQAAGISIGANLNSAFDNLEFTARFKTTQIVNLPDPDFFARLPEFEALSLEQMGSSGEKRWGWKEPNTHVVIDRILSAYPKMRYVHLLPNGFDMALSGNQNQPRLWGQIYLGRSVSEPITPDEALAYFCEVHRRIDALAQHPHNQSRILIVEFEALCGDPKAENARLLDFLQISPRVPLEALINIVQSPATIGRGRAVDLACFGALDISYMKTKLPHMMQS